MDGASYKSQWSLYTLWQNAWLWCVRSQDQILPSLVDMFIAKVTTTWTYTILATMTTQPSSHPETVKGWNEYSYQLSARVISLLWRWWTGLTAKVGFRQRYNNRKCCGLPRPPPHSLHTEEVSITHRRQHQSNSDCGGRIVVCTNTLECKGNYSATWNNMKSVRWLLMGGLLHLVQQWGDWTGQQPVQSSPRCTKCNSPPMNGQCTNHRIAVYWSVAVQF